MSCPLIKSSEPSAASVTLNSSIFPANLLEPDNELPILFPKPELNDNSKVACRSCSASRTWLMYISIISSWSEYTKARWYQRPSSTVWFVVTVTHPILLELALKYTWWFELIPNSTVPSFPPEKIVAFLPAAIGLSK